MLQTVVTISCSSFLFLCLDSLLWFYYIHWKGMGQSSLSCITSCLISVFHYSYDERYRYADMGFDLLERYRVFMRSRLLRSRRLGKNMKVDIVLKTRHKDISFLSSFYIFYLFFLSVANCCSGILFLILILVSWYFSLGCIIYLGRGWINVPCLVLVHTQFFVFLLWYQSEF